MAPSKPAPQSCSVIENPVKADVEETPAVSLWMRDTDMFSAQKLKSGIFSRLPSANIEEMFRCMQYVAFSAGQVALQQGASGDYYYLLESGDAVMTRITVSQNKPELIKTIGTGDFFGE